jgi:hypothetical protein
MKKAKTRELRPEYKRSDFKGLVRGNTWSGSRRVPMLLSWIPRSQSFFPTLRPLTLLCDHWPRLRSVPAFDVANPVELR